MPIRHKEFNEFIKGKGFKGRSKNKLKDLKATYDHWISSNDLHCVGHLEGPLPMNWNQRNSILCQRLQLLQEYRTLPFYMLKKIPGIKFTLMEKNIT